MLRRAGYGDVVVFERGERVGGVWHHNTYPGAACDVPSHLYEFSFAPNANWSRRCFPNMFLLYGPNTNGGTGSVIYVIEAAMGHVLAALRELERNAATRIELRPEAAEEFDRELRSALSKSVWHTGCTSWYLDENGNDPNQWPWLWTTYRRRTARLEPGAYQLGAATG